MAELKDVGDLVAVALADAGVRRAYMVPGANLWLQKAVIRHPDLTLYCARHESSAAFMAEADARLSGVPAVMMAGRSPGATNATNGVEAAHDSSTPMIVLLDDVETPSTRREAFQKLDLLEFYRPITKACFLARAEDSLPELISHALRVATGGRPGPVLVAIPTDMAGAASDWSPHPVGGLKPAAKPAAESITAIAQRLAQAEAPVIIAGGGAAHCREELVAVAEKFSAGLYVGFRRQDVFPNDHPLYLGHLGIAPPPASLVALREADLVLVVGTRLGQNTTQYFTLPRAGTAVMQIDIDPSRIGTSHPVVVGIAADAGVALTALLDTSVKVPERDWAAHHQAYLASAEIPEDRGVDGVDPAQVIAAMARELPADTVMANCAGGYATFVHTHWVYRHPRTQIAPTTGTMGYSVPAAIAAKLADPERCVVANSGDGGFLMTGHEIEVAVRYKADIIIVIYNNRRLSAGGFHDTVEGMDITDVDFASYARAFGAQGITVRETSQLAEAFRAARDSSVVTVIDVKTDPAISTPDNRPWGS